MRNWLHNYNYQSRGGKVARPVAWEGSVQVELQEEEAEAKGVFQGGPTVALYVRRFTFLLCLSGALVMLIATFVFPLPRTVFLAILTLAMALLFILLLSIHFWVEGEGGLPETGTRDARLILDGPDLKKMRVEEVQVGKKVQALENDNGLYRGGAA